MIISNRYFILSILLFVSILLFFSYSNIYGQQQEQQQNQPQNINGITLSDPNLKLELVTSGLDFPTTMAFLGPDDFLILEKSGTVKRVVDGQVLDKPLLQVDVSVKDERGLLGIAISDKKDTNNSNVTSTSSPSINKENHIMFFYTMLHVKEKILIVKIKSLDTI